MRNRSAVIYLALVSGPIAAEDRNRGTDVRDILTAKCAACHGPDLAKPKGRFGYVTDLTRVAANPGMVVPGRPDESELWELVRHDEMPPADSPTGPLTAEEKEAVRAWIAAGAPDGVAASATPTGGLVPPAPVARTTRWLGKFHLLVLHFPIALAIAAGVGEARGAWRRARSCPDAVRFCLWLAAASAVPTAALGWLHAAAGNGGGSPQTLTLHRWLGTMVAVWLVPTAVVAERDGRGGTRWRLRLMLAVAVLLTALTAHLGGLLDRGPDFFDW